MTPAARYAAGASVVAVACASVVLGLVLLRAPDRVGWVIAGWGTMSLCGILGGGWLAREHGHPGAGFVVALGSAMILRSIAALAVLGWALASGGGAYAPCIAGIAAGFVPQMVFEVVWFYRSGKRAGRGA